MKVQFFSAAPWVSIFSRSSSKFDLETVTYKLFLDFYWGQKNQNFQKNVLFFHCILIPTKNNVWLKSDIKVHWPFIRILNFVLSNPLIVNLTWLLVNSYHLNIKSSFFRNLHSWLWFFLPNVFCQSPMQEEEQEEGI